MTQIRSSSRRGASSPALFTLLHADPDHLRRLLVAALDAGPVRLPAGPGADPRTSSSTRTSCSGSTSRRLEQYFDYVWHLAHGDVGRYWEGADAREQRTTSQQQPIGPTLFQSFRTRSRSSSAARASSCCSRSRSAPSPGRGIGSPTDRAISIGTLVGVCTHPMVLGLILGDDVRLRPPELAAVRRVLPAVARRERLVRRRRRLGRASPAALVDLRAALPRALHAHDPRERRRDAPRGLRPDRTVEGRRRVPRRHAPRAAEREPARPHDGRHGDRHGDRRLHLHRGRLRDLRGSGAWPCMRWAARPPTSTFRTRLRSSR